MSLPKFQYRYEDYDSDYCNDTMRTGVRELTYNLKEFTSHFNDVIRALYSKMEQIEEAMQNSST